MSAAIDQTSIKTKLIATLGPASANREQLSAMFEVGLDVCRLNFSHGKFDEHERTLDLVRTVAAEHDRPVCIIGDLCGPKIRLGSFPGGPVKLEPGFELRFMRGAGDCTAQRLSVSHPTFVDEVQVGHRVYIDDGLVRLLVTDRRDDELVCSCTTGGVISNGKGVNLPDTQLSIPALTEKDRHDLDWAIEHDLDYVALSFARRPEDLYELKRLISA